MLMRRNGAWCMALVHINRYSQPDESMLIVVLEDIDQKKQLKALFRNMGYDHLIKAGAETRPGHKRLVNDFHGSSTQKTLHGQSQETSKKGVQRCFSEC